MVASVCHLLLLYARDIVLFLGGVGSYSVLWKPKYILVRIPFSTIPLFFFCFL